MLDRTSLEESLSRAAPQPTKYFAAELRQRSMQAFDRYQSLGRPRKTLPPTRRLVLSWGATLALVVLIGMLFTPPGRALAQAILQFEWFVFTHEPTWAEQVLTTTPEMRYELTTIYTEVANASEKAGFPVYYPTFLPEGYVSVRRAPVEIVFDSSGTVSSVVAMFEQTRSGKILWFSQIPQIVPDPGPVNFGAGDAEPQAVTVAGNDGVWLENLNWGTKPDDNGTRVVVPYNLLIWEISTEDGYTFQFWLGSEERLPLEVMLQIAESVAP